VVFGAIKEGSEQSGAGLPDGIFSNQKSQFGKILEGLAMKYVGVFYVHLVNFTGIWCILWPFGIFVYYLLYFSRFGIL
jgi:hypothetical protein